MKKPWYKKKPDFYLAEQKIIQERFPTLQYQEIGGKVFLLGVLKLNHSYKNEQIEDSYAIEIEFPDDYPESLPKVREVGGRKESIAKAREIKDIGDLHFNIDGSACLCPRVLEKKKFPPGSNIETFLEELVCPFFYALSFFEKHGRFPWGEYSHGDKGVLEAYSEYLGIDDLSFLIRCVWLLAKNGPIKGHWGCPCGSHEKFRKCHPEILRKLFGLKGCMSVSDIRKDLQALLRAVSIQRV